MSDLTVEAIEAAIGIPALAWARQCHMISLKIVQSGIVEGRVARGTAIGVGGQHSWVVVGDDCYAKDAQILDATLWYYVADEPYLWEGTAADGVHTPHGKGSIWKWGRPDEPVGPIIELAVQPKSHDARMFLDILGPLDRRGWATLSSAPVEEWPAAEILAAMDDTPALTALVPIDKLGMLTDRNPSGLYLKG